MSVETQKLTVTRRRATSTVAVRVAASVRSDDLVSDSADVG